MKIIKLAQGTSEWHDHRKKYLGASEMAAVLGLSPWKNPHTLWLEKTGQLEDIQTDKQWLFDKGHAKEIIARDKYEALTLKKFSPVVITNDDFPFISASLDGLSDDGELIEIKFLGLDDYMNVALGTKIPEKYVAQVQCQMALTETDKMTFIGINESDEIAHFTVVRDSAFIDSMMERAKDFWDKVINNEPIEIIPLVEDNGLEDFLRKYVELSEAIKEMTETKEQLKEAISMVAPSDKFSCGPYSYSKEVRKGQINYSKIPELKRIDLEKYRGNPATILKITRNKK